MLINKLRNYWVVDTIGVSCRLLLIIVVLSANNDAVALGNIKMITQIYGGTRYIGVDIYGNTRSWKVPKCDIYADSINGNDSNPGTKSAPLKTIAAVESAGITDGIRICLAADSYWREQLDISAENVGVYGYGKGKRPILDGADVVNNSSFSLVGGYTNVYKVESFGDAASPTETYLRVWENGSDIQYVSSLATCESTPGSFYVVDSNTYPKPVYIHATDSSNVSTNGKVYEISRRYSGVYGSSNGIVLKNIHAKRALHGNGVFRVLRNAEVNNCLAEDGTKHNMYISSGIVKDTVGWKARTDGRTTASIFVNYDNDATNLNIVYEKSIAIGTSAGISISDGIDGFYGHSVEENKNYNSVLLKECSVRNVTNGSGCGVRPGGTLYYNKFYADGVKTGIFSTDNVTIDNSKIDLSKYSVSGMSGISSSSTEGVNTIVNNGLIILKNGSSYALYGGSNFSINYSVIHRYAGTGWAWGMYRYTGKNPSWEINNTIISMSASSSNVIADGSTNNSISNSNNNVYYPSTNDFLVVNTNYTNFAAYMTGYGTPHGVDTNSISSDPLFVDSVNGNFSLQSGSPAIAIGAGLSNPNVNYTPIPSDEILAQW